MAHDGSHRERKRDWTRSQILTAAWQVAGHDGVGALSLREVAARVGMRTPSLYHYFGSKAALYDAMYAQAMADFAAALRASAPGPTARETLRNRARAFVTAAAADPTRFDLLFQRPVPGFTPAPEHLGFALSVLGETRAIAAEAGLRGDRDFDLFMATVRGLVAMQVANEPGGERWTRLVDEAVDLLVDHYASRPGPGRT